MARRRYTGEFKLEAVRLVRDQNLGMRQAAQDPDILMIFRWLARLFRPSGSVDPPPVPITRRITGKTIEETLHRFEDRYSEEYFQNVAVQESAEHTDGTLVRYEVRWKYSYIERRSRRDSDGRPVWG